MSCYFRHLKEIFVDAGIEITKENRKRVDRTIKNIVDVSEKECPQAWKKIKQEILTNEQERHDFTAQLRAALK
jgi:hypothetical protein